MLKGSMTAAGAARYTARHGEAGNNGFYRAVRGLAVSSIGLGTYLGGMDEGASRNYRDAIKAAARGGINVFDTAINYRAQTSERDLGEAIRDLTLAGTVERDEVLVCTKAGFLTPGAVTEGMPGEGDIAGGVHSMAPDFLEDQLRRSRENLGMECVDVFYLHNPETQPRFVESAEFEARIAAAFRRCEELCNRGWAMNYGIATWSGLRLKEGQAERLSLPRLVEIAKQAGGEDHRFRFVQLPVNLAMPEAFTLPHAWLGGEGVNVLECALRAGMTVVSSAPLLQGRLTTGLPEVVRGKWPPVKGDAQFALQFARSTPGVTVALAGMGRVEHVRENLELRRVAPVTAEEYVRVFERGA